jgi:crotonobetainyl-CoA:carnitine CoA-transferase CaiB-like acyl-CoA transferase
LSTIICSDAGSPIVDRAIQGIRSRISQKDGFVKNTFNESPFAALRIVECGQGISAAFATKLLADLGADVIKVEPPQGDLTRRRGPFPENTQASEKSGLFTYLNVNKRGVVADLTEPRGREMFRRLLERAGVLIHNVSPAERGSQGVQSEALSKEHPRLIIAAISIFGETGAFANYRGYDLTAANASGWAFVSPGASPYADLPPLRCFGDQCDFQAGVHTAMIALAAYLHRRKSGNGQSIEISEREVVTSLIENNLPHYTYAGRVASRLGNRVIGPWFIADCSDGQIFVIAVEEDQWRRLVELMGNPEWAHEQLFKDRLSRAQNNDALKVLMSDWLASWKVQDLYRAAQEHRIPFAPINTMQSLFASEHLRQRHFFTEFEQPGIGRLRLPGMPSRYSNSCWAIRRPAPRLGEHNREVFGS